MLRNSFELNALNPSRGNRYQWKKLENYSITQVITPSMPYECCW
jgi:hypothetical protein